MTKEKKKGFIESFKVLVHSRDHINIKNIRTSHLKYMLIFSLAPVFANMQGSLFSDSIKLFNLDPMTLMGSAYCIGAGVFFAFSNQKNMALLAKISAFLTALAFIIWLFLPESVLSLLVAIFFIFSLGGCAACAAFSYTFILNNSERLIGAAGISLFFAINQIMSSLFLFKRVYIFLLILGNCICLLFYKKEDFKEKEKKEKTRMNYPLTLTLYFFIAHYFIEIFYTYLPGASSSNAKLANGIIGILVVVLVILFQLTGIRSIWNMCNIFFIAMIVTYGLSFFPQVSLLRNLAFYFHGFEQMGYIVAYYLLGCVFKKHGNFRIFKLSLVIIIPLSMVSYVIPGAVHAYVPDALPLVATLVSSIVFIVFILLSPLYSKHLFYADWSDDFVSLDMKDKYEEYIIEGIDDYGFTPREREVVSLLMQGKDAKHIASNLEISVHTANFHIKNLYKKLGISSRSELFALFANLKEK